MAQDNPFKQSDRQIVFERQWTFYTGTPPKPLRPKRGQPDDNLIISLARLIVDKGASFLMGKDVPVTVPGGNEAQQKWLDECWKWNKRGITLLKTATNGGIFGHTFLRVLEGDPYPRIVVLDPQIVDVKTAPDDCDEVWAITITPPPDPNIDAGTRTRTLIANPHGLAGYRTDSEDTDWQIIQQEFHGGSWVDLNSADWPHPFCPIFQCQNIPKPNDFWGESDLPEDVLQILHGINRVASHYNRIIRLHAHPKVWTRGMGAQRIDTSIDAISHLPSETAEMKALEMQSDLSSTMALLEKLIATLSYVVRIPMVAMGEPDNLGSISGVALQIRYQPLVEKIEAKRLTYGAMLGWLDACLLYMGRISPAMVPTEVQWPELLPSDPLQERQVFVLDDQLGIASKETIAEKLGYDWEQEQKRISDQKQQAIADAQAAGIPPQGLQDDTVMLPNEQKKLVAGADTKQAAAVTG